MSSVLKNLLGAVGALAVLALAGSAVGYVTYYGRSVQPSSYRSFSVSGEGKSVSIPDVARFDFQVITEGGTDLGSLQQKNTEDANKAIAFVKGKGVEAKDIKTAYYNVNPRYTSYSCYDAPAPVYDLKSSSGSSGSVSGRAGGVAAAAPAPANPPTVKTCPPPTIAGYTVTQGVEVKIRDFAKIGDIMGGVVPNGANQVGSLSFTLDDPTSAQDTARTQAIQKAKAKAQAVADAGGFKLGRLLSVQENGNYPYPMYEKSYAMDSSAGAGRAAAPAPTVEPGSQETNVTVTLQYEIK